MKQEKTAFRVFTRKFGLWVMLSGMLLLLFNGCHPIYPPISRSSLSVITSSATLTGTVVAYPYPFVQETHLAYIPGNAYPVPSETTDYQFRTSPIPSQTELPLDVVNVEKLACIPAGDYAKCDDSTLGLEFEYPGRWGGIEATLKRGDTGLEYYYRFSNPTPEQMQSLAAGGISRDFTKGRGGSLLSFSGFGGDSGCEYYYWGAYCEVISQAVTLVLFFPNADLICDPGPTVLYSPIVLVAVDLPENLTVQGFVFISPFLSAEIESELHALLNITPEGASLNCDLASRQQFNALVGELVDGIRNHTLDSVTMDNLDKVYHLAQSIKIK